MEYLVQGNKAVAGYDQPEQISAKGKNVIILGGGHEMSFGHFLGYVNARLRVDVLNCMAVSMALVAVGNGLTAEPWTRPAESFGCTFFQRSGERLKPTR